MDNQINWLLQVPDDCPLGRLSLAGTHNSAAVGPTSSFLSHIASCQYMTFEEQLKCGIQVFDLRLRLAGGALSTFHGPVRYKTSFNELLDVSARHLTFHPYTFLVFLIKEELEILPSGLTSAYIAHLNNFKEYLHVGNAAKVGDLRGKIFIISRSCSLHSKYGISFQWPIHSNYHIARGFIIQDVYNVSSVVKAEKVRIAFNIKKYYKEHILINYMSVTSYASYMTELTSKSIWNQVFDIDSNNQPAFIILDYATNVQKHGLSPIWSFKGSSPRHFFYCEFTSQFCSLFMAYSSYKNYKINSDYKDIVFNVEIASCKTDTPLTTERYFVSTKLNDNNNVEGIQLIPVKNVTVLEFNSFVHYDYDVNDIVDKTSYNYTKKTCVVAYILYLCPNKEYRCNVCIDFGEFTNGKEDSIKLNIYNKINNMYKNLLVRYEFNVFKPNLYVRHDIKQYYSLRIFSWNIMAPSLRPSKQTCGDWNARANHIVDLIHQVNADIINLSEVDETFVYTESYSNDEIMHKLNFINQTELLNKRFIYKGIFERFETHYHFFYIPKTQPVDIKQKTHFNSVRHGNLLLLRKTRFEIKASEILRLDKDPKTDNQIIGFFRILDLLNNSIIHICTVHLKSQSSQKDINIDDPINVIKTKLTKTPKILSRLYNLELISNKYKNVSDLVLLCGDFNEHYTQEMLNKIDNSTAYKSYCSEMNSSEKNCQSTQAAIECKNEDAKDNSENIDRIDYVLTKNLYIDCKMVKYNDDMIKDYVLTHQLSDHFPICIDIINTIL